MNENVFFQGWGAGKFFSETFMTFFPSGSLRLRVIFFKRLWLQGAKNTVLRLPSPGFFHSVLSNVQRGKSLRKVALLCMGLPLRHFSNESIWFFVKKCTKIGNVNFKCRYQGTHLPVRFLRFSDSGIFLKKNYV